MAELSDDAGARASNLAVDAHGNVYFTESPGYRVRVVVRPGEIADPFPWGAVWAGSAVAAVSVLGIVYVVHIHRWRRRRDRESRLSASTVPGTPNA
ncbi:hypothetical protein [Phytoactinopolyspora endophytica]|uniref:hypothetical protein n=1 Tax=Phytoactinopolyspora endophytica TaxID=1642495 RepID=UPI0013EAA42B|nr:hypothetical protein [Phytoactinopolyspora endophytica]